MDRLRAAYPNLPADYFEFLSRTNGAEGDLGIHPGWFVIWPAEESLVATRGYQMPEYLPGFFAFGGNGGGELFVLPVNASGEGHPVSMVPAIGMAPDTLREVASSFGEFAAAMGKVWNVGT